MNSQTVQQPRNQFQHNQGAYYGQKYGFGDAEQNRPMQNQGVPFQSNQQGAHSLENKKEYEDHQIIRIDSKNAFLEVMKSGFEIGKVVMNFMTYDTTKQKGSRIKESISIYVDIEEFVQLAQDVKSGRMQQLAIHEKRTLQQDNGKKYAKAIFSSLGGTSAAALQKRGKSRPDGQPISRQFKITPGTSQDWMLSAEIGRGRPLQTGLIAPNYENGRPDTIVRIPMSSDNFKRLFLMTEMYIQSFITAQFLKDMQK